MQDLKIGTIPTLSANRTINLLANMYAKVINNNKSINTLPSVMLWGPPGIGKSQSVKQIASIIESETKKKVNVTDVRLILFNPVDLRGIPTSNVDKTLAVWLKPKIFDMDSSNDCINILFLDEISAAPQSVQAAAYQIVLDKTIGEHKLPDNCIVLAAGNRVTDKSVAYQMPKALANRLLHIEMEASFDSWNAWAIKNDIHPYVLGFLKFRESYLNNFNPQTSDLSFATPRSWEMVSNILNNVSSNIDEVYELIAGLVGKSVASEFKRWTRCFSKLPSIEDIFDGKNAIVPTETDVLYALTTSMLSYAKNHKSDLTRIENSINYATRIQSDFALVLLKDYMYIDKDMKSKLIRIPAYNTWLKKQGRLLDEANGMEFN